jgi:hypothetical protein
MDICWTFSYPDLSNHTTETEFEARVPVPLSLLIRSTGTATFYVSYISFAWNLVGLLF